MPIQDQIRRSSLLPGDIIIFFQSYIPVLESSIARYAFHCGIWVSEGTFDPRPLVHSVDSTQGFAFNGVLQQSSRIINTKYKAIAFRYQNPEVAKSAASYACRWAVASGSGIDRYLHFKRQVEEKRKKRGDSEKSLPLKTPFNNKDLRETAKRTDEEQAWSQYAILKAYQAFWRGESRQPLSKNRGVFCSQLVVLCYQAALIKHAIQNKKIPASLNYRAAIDVDPYGFSLQKRNSKLRAVRAKTAALESAITLGWQINAKKAHLDILATHLEGYDDFTLIGSIID